MTRSRCAACDSRKAIAVTQRRCSARAAPARSRAVVIVAGGAARDGARAGAPAPAEAAHGHGGSGAQAVDLAWQDIVAVPAKDERAPRAHYRVAAGAAAHRRDGAVARARAVGSVPAGGQRGRARLRLPGADQGDDRQLEQAGPHPARVADVPGRPRSTRRRPRWRRPRSCARACATTASGRCCAGRRRSSATASWSASARSRPPGRAATSSSRWAPTRTSSWCARSSRAPRPPA